MSMRLSLNEALSRYSAGTAYHTMPEFAGIELQSLYSEEMEADGTLQLLRLVIRPGQGVPLHRNDRGEGLYLVAGRVEVRRDRGAVELDAPSAAYFAAGSVHAIANVGREDAIVLLTFSRMGRPRLGTSEFVDPAVLEPAEGLPNPNEIRGAQPLFRWAVHESYEPWGPVEPSKGLRQSMKYLLDPARGTPDFVLGLARITAGTHYTLHSHEPAEFYHVLEGEGVIHVGGASYAVVPGDTVHVPSNVVHGIDAVSSDILVHWVYAVEEVGMNWTWRAAEDIYTDVRGLRGNR